MIQNHIKININPDISLNFGQPSFNPLSTVAKIIFTFQLLLPTIIVAFITNSILTTITTTQTIGLSAALLFLGSLFLKGSALSTLIFSANSVKGIGWEGLTPVMTIGMSVQNTSNQNLTINSFAAQAFTVSGGQSYKVGNIAYFTPQQIPANSMTIIYAKISLLPIQVINDIIRAFSTNNFTVAITVSGFANVEKYQLPIDLNYTVGAGI